MTLQCWCKPGTEVLVRLGYLCLSLKWSYQSIKLPFIYSEFTVHMQNQLKAGSFVGTRTGLSHYVQFFSYARAMKWTVLR